MTGPILATPTVPLDGDLVLTHDEQGPVAWVLSRYPGEAAVGSPAREWTLQLGLDLACEWAVDLWSMDDGTYQRIADFRGMSGAPTRVPSRVRSTARPSVASRRRA
jgi:hypothetical protein